MPLKVTNPEHEFSDCSSSGIDLNPEKLMRVHGEPDTFKDLLLFSEASQCVTCFSLESFHVFKCNVEEISCSAGWVQDCDIAKSVEEPSHLVFRFHELIRLRERDSRCPNGFPFLTKWFDDGRYDEPLDVGPWGVVSPEFVAFYGVEGSL